ncbi:MAG: glycosyltransferase [Flavobacteriales bacterium]|nr:glycosyltransferase [Flavobacteriales bacterium]
MLKGKRILVAPLDWGLGHAARCVPIIRALNEREATVVLAADGGPSALLRGEFPELEHHRLPGHHVSYASGGLMMWHMALQFPGFLRSIRREGSILREMIPRLRLDAVISDQRLGLSTEQIPTVLITHQLFPVAPFAQGLLRWMHRRYTDRFSRCWVPDGPDAPGLAGELSHGGIIADHVRFIGIQSRFKPCTDNGPDPNYDVVAVISGPEPHRTLFERSIFEQLEAISGRHLIILGQPGSGKPVRTDRITMCGHLPTEALRSAICSARLVVCRSGYSSLMDLARSGRRALLVPTPGQPEQEYLAGLCAEQGSHLVQPQRELNIGQVLSEWTTRAEVRSGHARLLGDALDELGMMLA